MKTSLLMVCALLNTLLIASERFSTSLTYLWMKSEQQEISYALLYSGSSSNPSLPVVEESLEATEFSFPFDFSSGIQITLGYEEIGTLWGLKGCWTLLPNRASAFTKSGSLITPEEGLTIGTLIPTFGNPLNLPEPLLSNQSVTASWKLLFNQIDLLAERKFEPATSLGLNLCLGLRLASIDQKIYSDTRRSGSTENEIFDARQEDHLHSHFKGIGPLIGFETRFLLWYGLNLLGSCKTALLYSDSKVDLQAHEIQNLRSHSYDRNFAHRSIKSSLDLSLGVEYLTSYKGYPFTLRTQWEHHLWFDSNLFASALDSPPWRGDFSYTGFSFGLDLIF